MTIYDCPLATKRSLLNCYFYTETYTGNICGMIDAEIAVGYNMVTESKARRQDMLACLWRRGFVTVHPGCAAVKWGFMEELLYIFQFTVYVHGGSREEKENRKRLQSSRKG